MRVLNFSESTLDNYAIMYEGMASQPASGMEARTLGKIYDKFDTVGVPINSNSPLRKLETEATIHLEDAEWELAKKLLNKVEWVGLGTKRAGKMLEWLETVPTLEQFNARKDGILKLDPTK